MMKRRWSWKTLPVVAAVAVLVAMVWVPITTQAEDQGTTVKATSTQPTGVTGSDDKTTEVFPRIKTIQFATSHAEEIITKEALVKQIPGVDEIAAVLEEYLATRKLKVVGYVVVDRKEDKDRTLHFTTTNVTFPVAPKDVVGIVTGTPTAIEPTTVGEVTYYCQVNNGSVKVPQPAEVASQMTPELRTKFITALIKHTYALAGGLNAKLERAFLMNDDVYRVNLVMPTKPAPNTVSSTR